MINFDFWALNFIIRYVKNPLFDFLMPKITVLGNYGMIWILSALVMLIIPRYRKGGVALYIGLIMGLLVGNLTLKPLVARPRPFNLVDGIELLIATPMDFSFPSGHTLSSVIAASIITMTDKKLGAVAIPLAFLISFSRLYLCVHFLTDILGAILLAIMISFIVYYNFLKNTKRDL